MQFSDDVIDGLPLSTEMRGEIMVIGITGGSGGGKTTVSKEFKRLGFNIIDADEVAHKVMEKGSTCLKDVIYTFGKEYLNEKGELDRKKLGALVFNNPDKLALLNSITHKHIISKIKEQITDKTVIDAIGLFDTELYSLCDSTIFVYCPKEIRVKRIMEREGINESYAISRINAQKDDEYFKAKADFTVVNDGTEDIIKQLKGFYGEEIF